jgi:hypothetical protein
VNHGRSIVFWVVLTAAPPAFAGEPTKAEIAVARQYFDAATAAENQGRWRDAIDQLNRAVAIKETPGLRYHLGFAKENLGLLAEALREYQRAAALMHSGMTSEEAQRFVVPKLDEMRRRVPTLTVTVPADVKTAQLQIDGATFKPELLGTAIALNPGAHAVVVVAEGRRPFQMQVTLTEGSAVMQAAELPPERATSTLAPAGPTPAASTSPPSSAPVEARRDASSEATSPARTLVLIGEAAVAAAGLGIGIGYLSAASAAQKRSDESKARIDATSMSCPSDMPALAADCNAFTTAVSDHRRDTNLSIAGFAGAGVGAAAFVATMILWKTSPQQAGLLVLPDVAPGGGGIAVRWNR